jgi:phosphatidylglycerophosphatase A
VDSDWGIVEHLTILEKKERRVLDRAAYFFATGMGAGFAPIAPGTFGSLEGIGIFLLILALPVTPAGRLTCLLALIAISFGVGVWASRARVNSMGAKIRARR